MGRSPGGITERLSEKSIEAVALLIGTGFTGFYRILQDFTGFYRILAVMPGWEMGFRAFG
jgi:hypothetical protein